MKHVMESESNTPKNMDKDLEKRIFFITKRDGRQVMDSCLITH